MRAFFLGVCHLRLHPLEYAIGICGIPICKATNPIPQAPTRRQLEAELDKEIGSFFALRCPTHGTSPCFLDGLAVLLRTKFAASRSYHQVSWSSSLRIAKAKPLQSPASALIEELHRTSLGSDVLALHRTTKAGHERSYGSYRSYMVL